MTSSSYAYRLHAGAKWIYRLSGGFFLALGGLALATALLRGFSDSDNYFMLGIGLIWLLIGGLIWRFSTRGSIAIDADSLTLGRAWGKRRYPYSQIAAIGRYDVRIQGGGPVAYLVRKRANGSLSSNLFIRLAGGKMVPLNLSNFAETEAIFQQMQARTGLPLETLTERTLADWRRAQA